MEKYGLLDSPSLVSSTDDVSLDEDGHIYKVMQRIPNIPRQQNIVKPKRLFKKLNTVAKGISLQEYFKKINRSLVTSSPLNNASRPNRVSLKLSPIPIRRNSIITGCLVDNKRNSRKSLDYLKTNRKSHRIRDENSYKNDLEGIEGTSNKLLEQGVQTDSRPNVKRESEILGDRTNKPISHSSMIENAPQWNLTQNTKPVKKKSDIASNTNVPTCSRILRSTSFLLNNNSQEDDENEFIKKSQTSCTGMDINETTPVKVLQDQSEVKRLSEHLENCEGEIFHNTRLGAHSSLSLNFHGPLSLSAVVVNRFNVTQSSLKIEEVGNNNSNTTFEEKTKMTDKEDNLIKNVREAEKMQETDNKKKKRTNSKVLDKTNKIKKPRNPRKSVAPIKIQKSTVEIPEPENKDTGRADPRLRRVIKPRTFYIQATIISPTASPKKGVRKKNKTKASKKQSDKTKTVNSRIQLDAEVTGSSRTIFESESNNEYFKKPKGRAPKIPKAKTNLKPNDTGLGSDRALEVIDAVDNAGIFEIDNTSTLHNRIHNSINSKSADILAGQNTSEVQNLEHESNSNQIISEGENDDAERRFSRRLRFNDHENLEPTNADETRKKFIHGVVDNRTVTLKWHSDKQTLDDCQLINVQYSLTNLKSHMCNISCGHVLFGPGQEKSQVTKRCVILYRVQKGIALVTQELVTVVMNPDQSFYIPLGSAYKIKNMSDSETLILYFTKVAP
ncbi:hypothetical protein RN001_015219 [Aquatica leii]|uniref:Uncharacterized protein n=1 Tax=Aquatica leii TaxID=1421715 RepID=A0AAN7NVD7_9COLE|nr:hypothetical protein RN001_015219 [Aquatica leii]